METKWQYVGGRKKDEHIEGEDVATNAVSLGISRNVSGDGSAWVVDWEPPPEILVEAARALADLDSRTETAGEWAIRIAHQLIEAEAAGRAPQGSP